LNNTMNLLILSVNYYMQGELEAASDADCTGTGVT
jgi:hypothetical protein